MIRELTEKDQQVYLEMSAAFYDTDAVDHEVNPDHARRTFDALMAGTPYAACFIAEEEEVQGFALLALTWSNEAGGLTVWIEELYVAPSMRGKGLGHTFMEYIRQAYPQAARFRLELTPSNERARALYRSLGYTPLQYDQMILDVPQ